MEYSFDEIKLWSWFVLRIPEAVTILPIEKIDDERFLTFEYNEKDNWVEYRSYITKNEWIKYNRNEAIKLMVTKEHPEWPKHAKKAIRLIFSKSIDLYTLKA